MGSTQDHLDAVSFKYRLKKLMLGKEVALVSEKNNVSQNEEPVNSLLVKVSSESETNSDSHDREVALELCVTSLLFKDRDLETEVVDNQVSLQDLHENKENVNDWQSTSTIIEEQSTSTVLEEQSTSTVLEEQSTSTVLEEQSTSTVLEEQSTSTVLEEQSTSTVLEEQSTSTVLEEQSTSSHRRTVN
ncbi:hypothetical protein Pcinc_012182 [Petrolisthes cinctipes]|uniref:Uncharacterized protein n=1 Tax=Petrolisthes cinctipes TaxID=88211 RepID=A0AAE1FZC6_PETCI|nr:hypothetical protein Pcinc_012182 [Petrolisthes cinctipes]